MEQAFDAFMQGWRDAEWSKVRTHMQLTGNAYGYNEQKLAELLGSVQPVSWEIVSTASTSPVMADIVARVTFDGTVHKQLTARLVRESAAFTPDEEGTWGVAPLSVLTIRDADDL
jgi:phage portal protein BeeE